MVKLTVADCTWECGAFITELSQLQVPFSVRLPTEQSGEFGR
jgi:hypothetical protein